MLIYLKQQFVCLINKRNIENKTVKNMFEIIVRLHYALKDFV